MQQFLNFAGSFSQDNSKPGKNSPSSQTALGVMPLSGPLIKGAVTIMSFIQYFCLNMS